MTQALRRLSLAGGGGSGDTIIDAGGAVTISIYAGAALVVTNAPDAITEVQANRRIPVNLSGRTMIAIGIGGTVPGAGLSHLQVSTNGGASFHAFVSPCTVADTGLAAGVGTLLGTAVAIAEADAVEDAIISWFTDGDATPTEDPAFTTVIAVIT